MERRRSRRRQRDFSWLVVVILLAWPPLAHGFVYEDVVGGEEITTADAVPFYAIGTASESLCGAVLIHPEFLLTAAHCRGAFRSGSTYLTPDTLLDTSSPVQVKKEIPHPNYNPTTLHNDIMLVQLETPVHSVPQANLPIASTNATILPPVQDKTTNNPDDDILLSVIGFGATYEGGPVNARLHHADQLTLLHPALCRALYAPHNVAYKFYSGSICAMGATQHAPQDACQGDSGGPVRVVLLRTIVVVLSCRAKILLLAGSSHSRVIILIILSYSHVMTLSLGLSHGDEVVGAYQESIQMLHRLWIPSSYPRLSDKNRARIVHNVVTATRDMLCICGYRTATPIIIIELASRFALSNHRDGSHSIFNAGHVLWMHEKRPAIRNRCVTLRARLSTPAIRLERNASVYSFRYATPVSSTTIPLMLYRLLRCPGPLQAITSRIASVYHASKLFYNYTTHAVSTTEMPRASSGNHLSSGWPRFARNNRRFHARLRVTLLPWHCRHFS